ncbi:MAG: hypothetical protein R3250_03315 [Melioribacteraceae bacterium]|nr:hypothetical protein [Melioribacteraceae bacterium]
MEKENALLIEVRAKIGTTVHTVWGPSTVHEVIQDKDGTWVVHLLEFGEEPYSINLSDWNASMA